MPNPSDPHRWHPDFPDDMKSVRRLEFFLSKMEQMVQGMWALDSAWLSMLEEYHKESIGDVIDEGYPFNQDFDELTYAASAWRDLVKEKLDAMIQKRRGRGPA